MGEKKQNALPVAPFDDGPLGEFKATSVKVFVWKRKMFKVFSFRGCLCAGTCIHHSSRIDKQVKSARNRKERWGVDGAEERIR